MRRILLVLSLTAVMAMVMAAPAMAAQPVGSCPDNFKLVTVKYVLKGAGLDSPDPSMDGNGDGYTCLHLGADKANGVPFEGGGLRAEWRDNTLPL
jgi:hypothetical protein